MKIKKSELKILIKEVLNEVFIPTPKAEMHTIKPIESELQSFAEEINSFLKENFPLEKLSNLRMNAMEILKNQKKLNRFQVFPKNQ